MLQFEAKCTNFLRDFHNILVKKIKTEENNPRITSHFSILFCIFAPKVIHAKTNNDL